MSIDREVVKKIAKLSRLKLTVAQTETTAKELSEVLVFVKKLEKIDQSLSPEEIQTFVYTVGKENGYEKNLRDWFKLIYQVLFGEEDGPRMGFFVSFFGLKETIGLINDKIK